MNMLRFKGQEHLWTFHDFDLKTVLAVLALETFLAVHCKKVQEMQESAKNARKCK